jgi:hypothetical protein
MPPVFFDEPLTEAEVNKGYLGISEHNISWLKVIVGHSSAMDCFQRFDEIMRNIPYGSHVKL